MFVNANVSIIGKLISVLAIVDSVNINCARNIMNFNKGFTSCTGLHAGRCIHDLVIP